MSYKVLAPFTQWQHGEYSLEAYRVQDLETIRIWRNTQMDILRQSAVLSPEDQARYWTSVIEPSFEQDTPRIVLLSFLKEGQLIGYGGLTNTDWQVKRTELSFLAATERTAEIAPDVYAADFAAYLTLVKYIVFQRLGFHRLFTETYDIRPLHIQCLEAAGMRLEGRMKDHAWANGQYVDSLLHGLLSHYPEATTLHGTVLER
jgi:RimJ/RimL family protein N-acetyltransferase